jgi:hypothetical protein
MNSSVLLQLLEPMAIIAAALSILIGLRGLRVQIQLTTYLEFTKRFEDVSGPLHKILRKYKNAQSLADIHPEDADDFRDLAARYFAVVSSEFHLQGTGHLDRRTWLLWSQLIPQMLKNPLVREVWYEAKPWYAPMCGFAQFIESQIRAGNS